MKILELFAGSRSIGKVAEKLNHKVFSSDVNQFGGIDYIQDILEFEYEKVPFIPDVIWSSPPCTGFSVASIGYHWTGGKGAYIPKTQTAELGIKLAQKTIEIIEYYKKLNPKLIWYIENPRGLLRKMEFMEKLPIRNTVTYCQYGDKRMKPTDIWTNNPNWTPRLKCKNGDPCHESAPRGSKTGTQGLKGAYQRSIIPEELCEEIILSSYKLNKNFMKIYCPNCKQHSNVNERRQGSGLLELFLWLFTFIGGLFYTIWRYQKYFYDCPICYNINTVPEESKQITQEEADKSNLKFFGWAIFIFLFFTIFFLVYN